ncbi:PXMP2/4 family protein 4-like isoform X1 [Juglans microcarpa x Juglans regia]|uniref:PXMP2/4 family protein 4-like isoform X1 n=1 Tax=Juglans microcarpa x Juglans regia TaxID=2249226 RepID=UPI001B7E5A82|nr:PXMP2/4 family protein 4-like isoform X1 [Juglans microcarpa x Juglans regia]
MGSNFIRNVCRYETRLCVAYDQITAEAQSLTKHQHWRAYARFPSQFSKIKGPRTSSSHPWSFSSSTSSSSSSSSSSSPSYSKAGFVGWYLSKLESRPLITKSISSCLIYTAADLTSQMITLPPLGSFDTVRTLRMAAYGLLILGPSQHLWFNLLSKILPKTDLLTTLKKIIMGQTIYGPAITTIFFSYNAGLQGESGQEVVARLKRDLLPTFKSGVLFWPICDFFTFKFVPVHLQPLMNSSCSYVWTIYLTYMASLKKVGTN